MTPDRFFSLLLALRSRPETTAAALAAATGVSVRTVVRDLHWLRDAGFPVLMRRGRYGGVFMLPGDAFDVSRLTPGEREQLALHGLDAEQRRRLGAGEVGARALRKMAGAPRGDGLLPVGELVVSDNRPWFGREPEGVSPAEIIGDLRRGVRLRIVYRRPGREDRRVTVDPHGLLAKGGRWYLVAEARGEPHLWNLARIARWEPLRAPRRLKAEGRLADVAAGLTSAWESAGEVEVRLLVRHHQVERAERMLGSRLSLGEDDGEGWTSATLRCRELEDVRQLLAFADSVTVLDPPEARERMRELAERILRHYR